MGKKNKYISSELFSEVLELIDDGSTTAEAISNIGLTQSVFYSRITVQQKLELQQSRVARSPGAMYY